MPTETTGQPLRVAVLDLYNGTPNQGMRAIRALLDAAGGRVVASEVHYDVFETRLKGSVPDLSYDVYLSSGGPGSPFDGGGTAWERRYFEWIDAVWDHNARRTNVGAQGDRKRVLFICHSFQIMCRHFGVAEVVERKSRSFGIFPIHKTPAGEADPLFGDLPDPFFAADFRDWQAIQPNHHALEALGGAVLAVEKPRPHVPLERATMAIRLSSDVVGVQFHPEADPQGMRWHFAEQARMDAIIEDHGEPKYWRMMRRMVDPAFLTQTYETFIPTFLRQSAAALRPEAA